MLPWRYLGLEISKRLAIKKNLKTLADLHQLCVSLNWVRPWLGITTKDLAPLFNLLKQGEEPSSPRILTQEVRQALEKVQEVMQELGGCDLACIHLAVKLSMGPLTKEELEHLLQGNKALQYCTGQLHRPNFNSASGPQII